MSFRKLAVNILPSKDPLSNERVVDMFTKLMQSQLHCEHFVVDKPADGSIFGFMLQAGEVISPDGYGWMDDDSISKITLDNGTELEILQRKLGFCPNEAAVSIKRTRYRLSTHPELNLLHYMSVPHIASVQVVPHAVKVVPRANMATPPQRAHSSASGASNSTGKRGGDDASRPEMNQSQAGGHSQTPQSYSSRKRTRPTTQTRPVSMVRTLEDEKDLSGDELDQGYTRVISLERYKRNHVFVDLLFSPYSASSLNVPRQFAGVTQEQIAKAKLHLEESEKEFTDSRNMFLKEIEDIKKAASAEWKCLEEVRHSKHEKDVDVCQEKAEKRFGAKFKAKNSQVVIVNLETAGVSDLAAVLPHMGVPEGETDTIMTASTTTTTTTTGDRVTNEIVT